MSENLNLKEVEQRAFTSTIRDGLTDVFIGCVLLVFALAPLLSRSLGDFWSSAIFLPFWGLVALAIRQARKHVVTPRVGVVEFGRARKRRLSRFVGIALAANVGALGLGILGARNAHWPGWVHLVTVQAVVLTGFSVAAYYLHFPRLYLYGALIVLSPVVGEWLYAHAGASHHGFPIAFGTTAAVMIVFGSVEFARLLRLPVMPEGDLLPEGTTDG